MRKSILLLLVHLSINSFAGQERGGGTENEREFVKMGRHAAAIIENDRKLGSRLFDGFNLPAFLEAIDTVEVYELPKVCEPDSIDGTTGGTLIGRCTDARYIERLKRIDFDVNIWKKKTCVERIALTVHEYGRASKNENGNYKYSSLMDRANISNLPNPCGSSGPSVQKPILGYVNKCRRNPIDGRGPYTSIYMSIIDLRGREVTQYSSLRVPMGSVQEAVTTGDCIASYNRLIEQGYVPSETLLRN